MRKVFLGLIFMILSSLVSPSLSSIPNFKPGSVLLDDETDDAFKQWIQKIFTAAGLNRYQPRIYVIVNPEVNAAASVGGNIFIYSEFLMKCDNAEQFLGVMAHEVGHIAGGHVSRMDAALNQAMVPAAAAVILGGALALASGSTAPLEAALAGGSHLFERGMLHFSRTQESAADQAALNYLEKLRWPAEGLSDFLNKIQKMYGSNARIDPYSVTHPLTPDRIQSIHDYMRKCTHKERSIPLDIENKFQRIKAKMMAFLEPQRALATYKSSDTSLSARYARAIAQYRLGQLSQASHMINDLVSEYPNDPYFHELKGQVLFETGDVGGAVPALRRADSLRPHSPLIKIMLAHALIESKMSSGPLEAIKILVPLTQRYPQSYPMAWRLLATAYGKNHQLGEAALALAEEALLQENYAVATSQANRAMKLLKSNPKALVRAKDLLSQIGNKAK
jgi:predicted Zn-dependent protease